MIIEFINILHNSSTSKTDILEDNSNYVIRKLSFIYIFLFVYQLLCRSCSSEKMSSISYSSQRLSIVYGPPGTTQKLPST
jgi:hypothetical protein